MDEPKETTPEPPRDEWAPPRPGWTGITFERGKVPVYTYGDEWAPHASQTSSNWVSVVLDANPVCPECKGSGYYVGLTVREPCKGCS